MNNNFKISSVKQQSLSKLLNDMPFCLWMFKPGMGPHNDFQNVVLGIVSNSEAHFLAGARGVGPGLSTPGRHLTVDT